MAQFKRGDFCTCDAPRPGRPKIVTTPEIIDQIHELILEDRRTSAVFQDCTLHGTQYTHHNLKHMLPQHCKSYNDVFLLIDGREENVVKQHN